MSPPGRPLRKEEAWRGMAWAGALLWAVCCAGAEAAAMKKWVLPDCPVRRGRQICLLAAAAAGGALSGWLAAGCTEPAYQLRGMLTLAVVGAGAATDLFQRRIPNLCSLVLAAGAAVCAALDLALAPETAGPVLCSGLLGGVILLAGLSLCRRLSRGGVGVGDIKLVSASALVMGLYGGLAMLLFAQAAAVLAAVGLLISGRAKWRDSLPFAPFLWLGLLLCLILGTY